MDKETEKDTQRMRIYFSWRRRKATKEKEKIFGDGKYLAGEGEEHRERKGGKYLEKENAWSIEEKEKDESILGRDILMHRG